jgi:hypothetical protein
MVLFAKSYKEFLVPYAELPNGVPSHDTFRRVFSLLEPDILRRCLNDYGKDVIGLSAEKQICPDGKKLRGVSSTSRGNTGMYIVNAWVSENRLCVGQKKVEDRSNEITAIPSLIEKLYITDAVVSIDAIGCRREIATQITTKGGHYLPALKKIRRICMKMRQLDLRPVQRKAFRKNGNTIIVATKCASAVSSLQKIPC